MLKDLRQIIKMSIDSQMTYQNASAKIALLIICSFVTLNYINFMIISIR